MLFFDYLLSSFADELSKINSDLNRSATYYQSELIDARHQIDELKVSKKKTHEEAQTIARLYNQSNINLQTCNISLNQTATQLETKIFDLARKNIDLNESLSSLDQCLVNESKCEMEKVRMNDSLQSQREFFRYSYFITFIFPSRN